VAIGGRSSRPSITNPTRLNAFKRADYVSCFELFFPFAWLTNVVLLHTNVELVQNRLRQMMIGEFLRYLGIWFLMVCFKGFSLSEYWSNKEISIVEDTPFRFHCYKFGTHFYPLLLSNFNRSFSN